MIITVIFDEKNGGACRLNNTEQNFAKTRLTEHPVQTNDS